MFTFRHPFTCIVSGPTQSGKTEFIKRLVQNADVLINPKPSIVTWCYGDINAIVGNNLPHVVFKDGICDINDFDPLENNLLILDDLMFEAGRSEAIQELFTKGSHHRNMSVIFVVHNLFHQGKWMRTLSLNAHYLVIFKNPRDAGQIKHLGVQLFPGKGGSMFLAEAYKLATQRPHGYLLLDFRQNTSDELRVLSNILPGEGTAFAYLPKK
jgi:hypothetical protein